ncbi:MAG: HAD family hydrolase [Bacteroidales bacterium]|nr:HAD family hydrolase [Bacteroidales bacterium]
MTIFWDWNGTLLDDVDVCIRCINHLLEARKLPLLSREKYLQIFDFPVKTYYEKAGFNFKKESFDDVAEEFMDWYYEYLPEADLYPESVNILNGFKSKGYRQVILSAMEHESLVKTLKKKGILPFFDEVAGISDIYANGKLESARVLIKKMNLNGSDNVLIGDTLHDLEVANDLGLRHILVADGHQAPQRLLAKTKNVVGRLTGLYKVL